MSTPWPARCKRQRLTGAPPFDGKDLPALIYAHLYSSPPRASGLAEGVPTAPGRGDRPRHGQGPRGALPERWPAGSGGPRGLADREAGPGDDAVAGSRMERDGLPRGRSASPPGKAWRPRRSWNHRRPLTAGDPGTIATPGPSQAPQTGGDPNRGGDGRLASPVPDSPTQRCRLTSLTRGAPRCSPRRCCTARASIGRRHLPPDKEDGGQGDIPARGPAPRALPRS